MNLRTALSVLAALSLSFALLACDAADAPPGPGDAHREPGPFEAMLAFLPADPAFLGTIPGVEMGNIARLRELAGEPAFDPAREDEHEYLTRLHDAAVALDLPFPGLWFVGTTAYGFAMTEHTRASMGFGIGDVEQWARPVVWRPRDMGLIRGAFDPGEAARLLSACGDCPPVEEVAHQGATYWRWGDDFETSPSERFTPPAFDDFGRGGRIAVLEPAVLRAEWDEGIEAMLDAAAGVGSLAGDERYRLAAEALDRVGTTTAFLSDWTQSTERAGEIMDIWRQTELAPVAEAWVPQPGEVVLEPYVAIGYGHGSDGGGRYTAVVLVHETESLAQANVPLVEDRLSSFDLGMEDLIGPTPQSVDVAVYGKVVVVTMRPTGLGQYTLGVPYFLHRP